MHHTQSHTHTHEPFEPIHMHLNLVATELRKIHQQDSWVVIIKEGPLEEV